MPARSVAVLICCHGRVTIRMWTKNYIQTYRHTYIHHHSWMNISVFPFSSFAVIPRGTHFNNFNIAASWIRSKNDHSMKLKQETPSCIWVCPRKPTGFSWFLMMFILEMTWTGGQPPSSPKDIPNLNGSYAVHAAAAGKNVGRAQCSSSCSFGFLMVFVGQCLASNASVAEGFQGFQGFQGQFTKLEAFGKFDMWKAESFGSSTSVPADQSHEDAHGRQERAHLKGRLGARCGLWMAAFEQFFRRWSLSKWPNHR